MSITKTSSAAVGSIEYSTQASPWLEVTSAPVPSGTPMVSPPCPPMSVADARQQLEEAGSQAYVAMQARNKARLAADNQMKRLDLWNLMRADHLATGSSGWSESDYQAVKASAEQTAVALTAAEQAYAQAMAAQNEAQATLDAMLPAPPAPAPASYGVAVFGGSAPAAPAPVPAPYAPPVVMVPPPPPPPSPAQLAAQAKVDALTNQDSMQATALASAMSAEAFAKTSLYRWNTMRAEHLAAHGSLDASTGWSESDYQSIVATAARTQAEAEKATILRNNTLYELRAALSALYALAEPAPVYPSGVVFGGGGVPSTAKAEPDAATKAALAILGDGRPVLYKEPTTPAAAPANTAGPVFGGSAPAAPAPAPVPYAPPAGPVFGGGGVPSTSSSGLDAVNQAALAVLGAAPGVSAASMRAAGASVAAAVSAAPRERPASQWADIKAVWNDRQDEPALLMDLMRQFGFDAADLAYATGQSVAAVGHYLARNGAADGFAGWSESRGYESTGRVVAAAPTPAAPTLSAAPRERPASQWADIKAVWEDRKDQPALLMDLMRQFGFDAADLAYATGQSVAAVGSYLLRNGADDGFAGWGASRGYEGTGRVSAPANGAPRERTQKQWDDIKAVWEDRKDEPLRLIQLMQEYGFDVADIAFATAQTQYAIGDYLTLNGAPAGFGGPATLGRGAVDEPYLAALNEARQRAGAAFNLQEFNKWYVSQDNPQAQAFARIHGAEVDGVERGSMFRRSGATLIPPAGDMGWHISWAVNDTAVRDYLSSSLNTKRVRQEMTLLLQDPLNQQLLAFYNANIEKQQAAYNASTGKKGWLFGPPSLAQLPDNEQGRFMTERYGVELATQLYRLDLAMRQVRDSYAKAVDEALRQKPVSPMQGVSRPRSDFYSGLPAWWIVTRNDWASSPPDRASTPDASFTFNPQAFTDHYLAQGGQAAQLFKALYGDKLSQPVWTTGPATDREIHSLTLIGRDKQFQLRLGAQVYDGPNDARSRWEATSVGSSDIGELVRIDLARPPKMHDAGQVFFDPTMGWATTAENIDNDSFFDKAFPVLLGGAAAYFGGPYLAQAAGFGGNAAAIAAFGAASATAVTGLAINGKIDFADVVKSALTSAFTAGITNALSLDTMGTALNADGVRVVTDWGQRFLGAAGQVTLSGFAAELSGADFADGLKGGIASVVAQEIVRGLEVKIGEMGDLSAPARSQLNIATRALGAGIRAALTDGDPLQALAIEYLQGLGLNIKGDIDEAMQQQAQAQNRTDLNKVNQVSDANYYDRNYSHWPDETNAIYGQQDGWAKEYQESISDTQKQQFHQNEIRYDNALNALYGGSGYPRPFTYSQGKFGDCYLLAAINAVARQDPASILNRISVEHDGTYTVTLPFPNTTEGVEYYGITASSNFNVAFRSDDGYVVGTSIRLYAADGTLNGSEGVYPLILENAIMQLYAGGVVVNDTPDVTDFTNASKGIPVNPLQLLTGRVDTGIYVHDSGNQSFAYYVNTGISDVYDKGSRVPNGTTAGAMPDDGYVRADYRLKDMRDDFNFGSAMVATTGPFKQDFFTEHVASHHAYTVTGFSTDLLGSTVIELSNPHNPGGGISVALTPSGLRYPLLGNLYLTEEQFFRLFNAVHVSRPNKIPYRKN